MTDGVAPGAASREAMVDLVAENKALLTMIKDERKDRTRVYLTVIAVLAVTVVILLYLCFVYFPRNQFLATDNVAAVCRVPTLDKPYIPQAQVMDFAAKSVVSIYTYTYGDYRLRAQETANKYFSNDFAGAFINLFSNSNDLQVVIQKRFNVTATGTANQPPIVARAGPRKGAWAWQIDVPVTVYYVSGRDQYEEKKLANVTVMQVPPTRINPSGLAVDDIVLRQALN